MWLAAAAWVLACGLAGGCSGERTWQERWEWRDPAPGASRQATLGVTWANPERTRGEFGFHFTSTNDGQGQGQAVAWDVSGTFTAEHGTPDFCGRAKWTPDSSCTQFRFWPTGDEPPPGLQQQLDSLGLPDRHVQSYLMFVDGRSHDVSLVRATDGSRETRWRAADTK